MSAHPYLADLLDETVAYVRAHVVFGEAEGDTVSLWNAHTYVYDCVVATPYLHPWSPEPGSGKTTLLDVLEVISHEPLQVDNISESALFRLIERDHPTLLLDEIDAVFGRQVTEKADAIGQVLKSGYRKGKKAIRCSPPRQDPISFDVYCPKATAGLGPLPAALAHRSIPIAMKPPRPSDHYEDFDYEEAIDDAETLRRNLASWAEEADGVMRDKRRKPEKVAGLDARANQIWRILFRIADHAGGEWPERARAAALGLSAVASRQGETSSAVQLLGHIRELFDGERMTCASLVDLLNDDDLPYGGWNDGKGITSRNLGKKLGPYGIVAKPVRIDGERAGNGYERDQFEDAWERYLSQEAEEKPVQTSTTRIVEPKNGVSETGTEALFEGFVPVSKNGANPHEYSDVPVWTGLNAAEQTGTEEWLALDGNWRSYETDPPNALDRVVDKRQQSARETTEGEL